MKISNYNSTPRYRVDIADDPDDVLVKQSYHHKTFDALLSFLTNMAYEANDEFIYVYKHDAVYVEKLFFTSDSNLCLSIYKGFFIKSNDIALELESLMLKEIANLKFKKRNFIFKLVDGQVINF